MRIRADIRNFKGYFKINLVACMIITSMYAPHTIHYVHVIHTAAAATPAAASS